MLLLSALHYIPGWSRFLSVNDLKPSSKSNPVREGFIWLVLLVPSLKEVREVTQAEMVEKSCLLAHCKLRFNSCFNTALDYQLREWCCQKWVKIYINSQSRWCPTDRIVGQSILKNCFSETPFTGDASLSSWHLEIPRILQPVPT